MFSIWINPVIPAMVGGSAGFAIAAFIANKQEGPLDDCRACSIVFILTLVGTLGAVLITTLVLKML